MMKTRHKIIIGDCRNMKNIPDKSVHLIVTSPPYPMIEMWDAMFKEQDDRIKNEFEGFNTLSSEEDKEKCVTKIYDLMHENLEKVWKEVYRVLVDGGIACINIGDATRKMNGIFRLFTNHSRVIEQCENIGFVTLPYLIWRKPTNKPNAFLGSGFLPPNAYVTLDTESILIFRKGNLRMLKTPKEKQARYLSKFTKDERDIWFTQTWEIKGEKQSHNSLGRRTAAYPEEIPRRLIKMFSLVGDVVLDPFLGTGTTTKVAKELGRNSIGFELEKQMLPIMKERIGLLQKTINDASSVEVIE